MEETQNLVSTQRLYTEAILGNRLEGLVDPTKSNPVTLTGYHHHHNTDSERK